MKKILAILFVLSVYAVSIIGVSYRDTRLVVYYLSIGQGDSILVKSPDQRLMLIDGGFDQTVLGRLGEVLPFWVRKIDFVMLSHPDLDHLGGLNDVLERYDVKNVLVGSGESKSQAYQHFSRQISDLGINTYQLNSENDFTFGCCVEIDMLWPLKNSNLSLSVNNSSLAFELKYLEFSAYFAGDLEHFYEQAATQGKNIDVDVMKLSHHGSRTSTSATLLENINPEIAIVSAGRDNKFGHPHDEVLDLLEDSSIRVLRTDQMGTITLRSDGYNYSVETEY